MGQRQWISIVCAVALGMSVSMALADGKGKGQGGDLGKGGGLAAGEPSPGAAAAATPGGASGGVAATSAEPAASAPGPIANTVGAGTVGARARDCDRVVPGDVARTATPVYPNGVVGGPSPAGVPPGPIADASATPAQPGLPGC